MYPNKITLANEWIENEQTQMKRLIVQGAIFTCELGENIGTEQNGERSVLVLLMTELTVHPVMLR